MPRPRDPRFQTATSDNLPEPTTLARERRVRERRAARAEAEIFEAMQADRDPDTYCDTADQTDTGRGELLCGGLLPPANFTDDELQEW